MKIKKRDKDRVTLKVNYYVDYSKNYYDRVNDENKMAAYIQKELKNWWKKHTTAPFILICEAGNVVDHSPYFPFIIEKTELNQTEEEQENFKTLCAAKTKEIIEEYLLTNRK